MNRASTAFVKYWVPLKVKPHHPARHLPFLRSSLWFILLQLAIVMVLAGIYAPYQLDLGDEGNLAHLAERVLDGEIPHRDFYSLQGPLSHYLMAGWSWLWGLSFFKLRVAGVLIHCAIAVLTFLIARAVGAGRWAFAAGACAVLTGPLHSNFAPHAAWQGIALSLFAIWAALASVRNGDRRYAMLSGVVASLAVLCRHDQGAYMVLSIAVLAIALRLARQVPDSMRFPIGAWMLGALSVALPTFLLGWGLGALPAMWDQLVMFPLTQYASTSGIPMPWFDQEGPMGSMLAIVFFRLAPLLSSVAAALVLWKGLRKGFTTHEAMGLFLITFTLLFHAQVLARSDLPHLVITMLPALVLLAWLPGYAVTAIGVVHPSGEGRRTTTQLVHVAAGLAFVMVITTSSHLLLPARPDDARALDNARAGVMVPEAKAAMIEGTVEAIQAHTTPDEAIIVLPYHPAFHVLAERRNPTHWGYHWPGDRSESDQRDLVAQAELDMPGVVVVFDPENSETYLGTVMAWVEANYTAVDAFAVPVIYRRR